MAQSVTLIGFGEAAQTFCGDARWTGRVRAFDIKTTRPAERDAKLSDYARLGVTSCDSAEEAVRGAEMILSLVTARQASAALEACLPALAPSAMFCDCNSTAPDVKRANAAKAEAKGARYVDVAIMSPVRPAALAAPLNVSGPGAAAAIDALGALGFSNLADMGAEIGRAAAIKMIRSVMIKGIEALTAECALAAEAANVREEVLASLGADWAERFNYNLERMMAHGVRRAEEMDDVALTLESLGVAPLMTRAAVDRQNALGVLGIAPPDTLQGKLDAIRARAPMEAE